MSESTNDVPDTDLSTIKQAYRQVTAALETMPDLQQAYGSATRLADGLREMADAAALIRAKVAARIRDVEGLSLAGLATKLGVSKARADQLLKAARGE